MSSRLREIAVFALVLSCGVECRAQSLQGTRRVRVEYGTVVMSSLPEDPRAATVSPHASEDEGPFHPSAPEFRLPFSVQSRLKQQKQSLTMAMTALNSAASSFNTFNSPAPTVSFLAQTMTTTTYPPDTNGAVGPNHVMAPTNERIVIQNRQGQVLTSTWLTSFWNTTWPDINPAWDPNIRYDPYEDRWILVCMANYQEIGSSLLIAVSATSDPTGAWYLRRIYADPSNTTTFDHPRLGFNNNWIVVTGNEISNSTSSWLYSVVYAFDKADFYANGTKAPVKWSDITNAFTLSPATTYDPTVGTMYLLANYNGNDASTAPATGYLNLSTITGAVGSEVLNVNVAYPSTTNVWASNVPSPPNLAPQLGIPDKIGVFDARMNTVVYRNGSLWATHTVFLPATSPTHSAVDWWQVGTDGTVQQFGRIEDPSGTYFYAYPSLSVNVNGDMLIGYSRMASTEYASAAYTFRTSADPVGTVRNEYVVQPGQGTYALYDGARANRWGDYSGTQVDPLNDTDFWTVQEYAAPSSSGSHWSTWWGNVVPPPTSAVALQSVRVNPSAVTGGQASTGTLTLSNAAPSGGAVVSLASNNAAAQLSSTVTVPANASTATFNITTSAVSAATAVTISANYNGVTQATILTLGGSAGSTYQLSASTQSNRNGAIVLSAATLSGTAYVFTSFAANLTNFNPTGITKVSYWLDNPAMTGTPTHTESFSPYDFAGSLCNQPTCGANPWNTTTAADGTHTITQLVNESSGATETETATFSINNSFPLRSVSTNPATVTAGQGSTGSVTLSSVAPSGGAVVSLSSNNAAAQVPLSVTIPANATSAPFNITTSTVGVATLVTISANYNGVTQTTTLTVNPVDILQSVSVNPSAVTGGQGSTGTVTLSNAALSGGAAVSLSSNNAAAQVPLNVTIPANATI